MKNRLIHCLILCLLADLSFVGCQTTEEAIIPVTGADAVPIPARVETARSSILEYVGASDQLENPPPVTGWELDITDRRQGEYRFVNGDWFMVIKTANAQQQHEHILLYNHATHTGWSGYVCTDGHVVDASYMP